MGGYDVARPAARPPGVGLLTFCSTAALSGCGRRLVLPSFRGYDRCYRLTGWIEMRGVEREGKFSNQRLCLAAGVHGKNNT